MKNSLEAESIIHYYGTRTILSDIYLKCETGEVVGILGRNGSGKSTLLKIIFGTLPAHNKIIRMNGKVYQQPYKMPGLIGYLPQQRFLPRNISLKRIVKVFIKDSSKHKDILTNEHIIPHLEKYPRELSGGELRYFEILMLVNANAKFIMLDEPFSGIEPIYRERVKELIQLHRNEKGFIITDHDYRSIIDVSTRIVLIYDGSLKKIDKVGELEQFNYVPEGTFTAPTGDISPDNSPPVPFETDKQTLRDLDLYASGRDGAIFSIFNHTQTIGGYRQLDYFLLNPLTDKKTLKARSDSIRFLNDHCIYLAKDKEHIDFVEHYLASGISLLRKNPVDAVIHHLRSRLKPSNEYYIIQTGIRYLTTLFQNITTMLRVHAAIPKPAYLAQCFFNMQDLITLPEISELINSSETSVLYPWQIARYDHFFRKEAKEKIREVLDFVYEIDAFESVGKAAEKYHLTFPEYIELSTPTVRFCDLFHPLLSQPVSNNFEFPNSSTLCFLSGANMSGKSTFLKAFGLAVHLAHVGFPVPAKRMETTVFRGIITSINLSDNITRGYSHFYSEVQRVKEAAIKIQKQGRMLIIFDELFRGTNVKDAADASLLIISALSKIPDSLFLVSTHIVEIAEELQIQPTIIFRCFESKLEGEVPVYNYKIGEGISKERLGMQIVRNEKILEILESVIRKDRI